MKLQNLKQGEYYGYYNKSGKWITGQNGPNPMTAEQRALVDNGLYELRNPHIAFVRSLKAFIKDLGLFLIGKLK